ncbi:Mor transcription activator family protein [Comamonas terrigena]|uniref:Mor transcription activator family protein n=1 Tax=Comamonas terrigena TaxID=32013 RepID=UPI0028A170F0|nr:Mor transcription activator family protein [Comamonas terrigena]
MSNSTPRTTVASAANKLDPIAVLREELAAVAASHGVERVEDLTDSLVSRLVQRLGGGYVYFTTQRGLKKKKMAEEIRQRFNGFNTRELAQTYGISARHVRRIVEVLRCSGS